MYDSHLHSSNSLDCEVPVDTICKIAIEKGMKGITVTDHATVFRYKKDENYTQHIKDCFADIDAANEKYKGLLTVRKGVEIGEYLYDPEIAKDFIELEGIDVVLGSLHEMEFMGYSESMTDIMSRPFFKIEYLDDIICKYYDTLIETAKVADFDVLAHITYPVRYSYRFFGISTLAPHVCKKVTELLKIAVERNIAIEVNTASIGRDHNEFVPNEQVLAEYKKLGGRLVTIGSDAHRESQVCAHIEKAKAMLKNLGFEHYYYFDKRKPVAVKL